MQPSISDLLATGDAVFVDEFEASLTVQHPKPKPKTRTLSDLQTHHIFTEADYHFILSSRSCSVVMNDPYVEDHYFEMSHPPPKHMPTLYTKPKVKDTVSFVKLPPKTLGCIPLSGSGVRPVLPDFNPPVQKHGLSSHYFLNLLIEKVYSYHLVCFRRYFFAELNEFLERELASAGFAGLNVRQTPLRTEVVIHATKTSEVLGEGARRIRELTSIISKRWGFEEGRLALFAKRVEERGLCAAAQAESIKFKILGGTAVRKACYGVIRQITEAGGKGCEIMISGKVRGARAKSLKFGSGYMIKTGQPNIDHVETATRHVLLKQGVLGIKVSIMLPQPKNPQVSSVLPDKITFYEPKETEHVGEPESKVYITFPTAVPAQ
ncbi:hypothetical protein GEMRC1_011714 [Eukaryota sp. GEM-RC1]